MNQFDLIAMFTLGLLGNAHCIGMCGPLVVSLPGQTGEFSSHLLYHSGRILTYTFIGALMGIMGSGLVKLGLLLNMPPLDLVRNVQLGISFLAAVALLIFGLALLGMAVKPDITFSDGTSSRFRQSVQKTMLNPTPLRMFISGLVLGFLPCGMSFAAFARALATGSFIKGGLCLAFFGVGTLPGLLLVGTGGTALFRKYRRQCDFAAGFFMLAMSFKIASKTLGMISTAWF